MKVIFLDVDGVLNCRTTFTRENKRYGCWLLEPVMLERMQHIVRETGAEVVLSSVWRSYRAGKVKIRKYIKFIGCTEHLHGIRGEEIEAWLKAHHNIEKYCIIDDDSDMLPNQKLFQTRFETGLTEEIEKKVIAYLNYD